MKRMYPTRTSGRFQCLDGMNHPWFFPVCKTLLQSIKTCFLQKLSKQELAQLVMKPSFISSSKEPLVTWLGHSTFLIQVGGKNILTDPIFGSLSFVFRRMIPRMVHIKDLPKIDYVMISHNHFDHMDSFSLLALKKRFPDVRLLVPMGDKRWCDQHKFKNSSEHMWWDQIIDQENIDLKFTFLPANHWSQRGFFDKNRSLWGSWMVQYKDWSLYFAGDTSWGNHFSVIGHEFKKIDVACMPIGPGEPRSWMKDSHINATEAGDGFLQLGAHHLVPMHWGTFNLGFDGYYDQLEQLAMWWSSKKELFSDRQLVVPKVGASLQYRSEKKKTVLLPQKEQSLIQLF